MKRNLKLWWIILGTAIMLIAIIYNQQQRQQITTPSPSPIQETLTEEEKFILNPPDESSKSALKKHQQMVAELANEGTVLEIKNDCKPNPLVLKVKQGSEIEIKNLDGYDRRIIIDSKHYYDIPKGDSKRIKAQFKYGTGDYGYVCEGVGIVGFLHVV